MPRTGGSEGSSQTTVGRDEDLFPLACVADRINPLFRVRDLMKRDLHCGHADTAISRIARILRLANCGIVPLVESSRPVGVVTERDVALALSIHGRDLPDLPAREVMSSPVVSVKVDARIGKAVDRMCESGRSRLVVIDRHGRLEGILGLADLVGKIPDRGIGYLLRRIHEPRAIRHGLIKCA